MVVIAGGPRVVDNQRLKPSPWEKEPSILVDLPRAYLGRVSVARPSERPEGKNAAIAPRSQLERRAATGGGSKETDGSVSGANR